MDTPAMKRLILFQAKDGVKNAGTLMRLQTFKNPKPLFPRIFLWRYADTQLPYTNYSQSSYLQQKDVLPCLYLIDCISTEVIFFLYDPVYSDLYWTVSSK